MAREVSERCTHSGSGSARESTSLGHHSTKQMGKKKTARGALLAANLPQLQNLIKRDPEGYREEVAAYSVRSAFPGSDNFILVPAAASSF